MVSFIHSTKHLLFFWNLVQHVIKLMKKIRPYQSLEKLGVSAYQLQGYFITHLMFILTNWGAVCLKERSLFAEELTFLLTNMKVVMEMNDPELVGEYLQVGSVCVWLVCMWLVWNTSIILTSTCICMVTISRSIFLACQMSIQSWSKVKLFSYWVFCLVEWMNETMDSSVIADA